MNKILIIEDDQTLNDGLKYALEKDYKVIQNYGYDPIKDDCDLAILDINLPGKNGFELSKLLTCPIIFLTAKSDEKDMLEGYSLGCEDYITKPFSLAVLKEKVKVVLKRHGNEEIYQYKNLLYDYKKRQLIFDQVEIALTKKEYEILDYMIKHKEQVLSKQQLLEAIWDVHGDFVNEGTVNVTINRLRKKIPEGEKWIQTIFGIGYKWSEKHELS